MAGLCAPLPTLRRRPYGRPRTARGRRGSLLLHRKGLAPSTPCRSPGAFAVGTAVARRPPHRSVRAQFGHTASKALLRLLASERLGHTSPALCPVCALLACVPLGP